MNTVVVHSVVFLSNTFMVAMIVGNYLQRFTNTEEQTGNSWEKLFWCRLMYFHPVRYSVFEVLFLIQIQYKYTNRQMPSPAQNSHNFWLLSSCVFHQNHINFGRQGNMVQTLAQWQHPVASSEALDVLHWTMHPASHQCIPMVIKIASNFLIFFAWSFLLSPKTVAYDHAMVTVI